MNYKQLLGLLVFSTLSCVLMGQTQGTPAPGGMQTPKWVLMMEDSQTNYFEAIQVYKDYWKTTPKPVEEEESDDLKDKSAKRIRRERAEREREENGKKSLSGSELEKTEYLKYQSKRFEDWARDVKPWVQENGHILTDTERDDIRRRQEEELKRQQGK